MEGLIAMLSHDLRTPLSAIAGWLFLLESGKLDADAQKRAVAKIKTAVDDQVQLIDDTLLLSQSEAGRLALDHATVPASTPLSAAITALRSAAAAKNVSIAGDVSRLDATVDGDARCLQRAFSLLLMHALKFTPDDGRIEVKAMRAMPGGDRLDVAITRNGPATAPEEVTQMLDPSRRMPDGSGKRQRGPERGLVLANALIAAHGGSLSIAGGTAKQDETMTISLPLRAAR